MDRSHLLAAELIEETPPFLAESLVRYRLDLGAAIGVERQKRTAVEIDILDRPAVRSEKNGWSA